MKHVLHAPTSNLEALDQNGNTYLHYLAHAPALGHFLPNIAPHMERHIEQLKNGAGKTPLDIARKGNNRQFLQTYKKFQDLQKMFREAEPHFIWSMLQPTSYMHI